MNNIVAGVDIGGTHITASLVDLSTCTLLESSIVRREVNAAGKAAEIIDEWCAALEPVMSGSSSFCGKIGVAMPGPFNYEEGVSLIQDQGKYDKLFNCNIKAMLAARLRLPAENIRFINDAACFLQGEVMSGIAKNHARSIGLTLGTGLGSAKFDNGIAEDADLWKSPFKAGIAEDYLSTRWFAKRYQELTGEEITGVKQLAQMARKNSSATGIFREFGRNLALFLMEFIAMEKPEVVVIGGNISKAHELFFPEMQKTLVKEGITVPIRVAELGEVAALVGAASCWLLDKELVLNSTVS